MPDGDMVYKYKIPLDATRNHAKPLYQPNVSGDLVSMKYGSDNLVVIQTEAAPHFHRDSVNVQVEEVEKSEYT